MFEDWEVGWKALKFCKCVYCGHVPTYGLKAKAIAAIGGEWMVFTAPLDNTCWLGYLSVPHLHLNRVCCCGLCNMRKSWGSAVDFNKLAANIANNIFGTNIIPDFFLV